MTDILSVDIFPEEPRHLDVPLKKEFKPWHKPRKQFVRRHQWHKEADTLIKELIPRLQRENRPLRYFSLPGQDMLDIRILSELCEIYEIQMNILGFDTAGTEANISWHEVSKYISPTSLISKNNICELASKTSIAYKKMTQIGPFDIVNIDLCDSAASLAQSVEYHTAFTNLLEFQVNEKVEPWLFFITTRCDKQSVCEEVMRQYQLNVKRNAEQSTTFKNLLSSYGIVFDEQNNIDNIINTFVRAQYFPVCFGKWLLGVLSSVQNRWNLTMLDSYWYKVRPNALAPDMLSLGFILRPNIQRLSDPTGIAVVGDSTANNEPNEEYQAISIVEKSFALEDIDEILHCKEEIRRAMIEESATLMNSARYSKEDYIRWVESGCL